MSQVLRNIFRDIKRDKIIQHAIGKHRYISPEVYSRLKNKSRCDRCKKKFCGVIPEIHHKIAVQDGGTNEESNLMAVHIKCHKKLNNIQDNERLYLKVKNE